MLHIQNSLRAGATLEALQAAPYSLVIRRHQDFPNLVLFKYNQIESDMDSPLVCQCRGLILDEADNWACVSRPFDKFWNVHEGRAATIDWATARVQEKLDGSLMQLYWYRGQWRVGTSGTPDASGEVNGSDKTFRELFWQTWDQMGLVLPAQGAHGLTFVFELMTALNRVVVRHAAPSLRLIGVRDVVLGREFRVSMQWGFPAVREFPLTSFADVVASFDTFQPLDQEGYVIVDKAFNRIKVKHPGYVALHHLRDHLTPKGILDVIRRAEVDEVLASFPEWRPEFTRIGKAFGLLVDHIERIWDLFKHRPTQKEYALEVKDYPFSGVLFALRKGTVATVREALLNVQIDRLTEWLILEDESGETHDTAETTDSTGGPGAVPGTPVPQPD